MPRKCNRLEHIRCQAQLKSIRVEEICLITYFFLDRKHRIHSDSILYTQSSFSPTVTVRLK